MVPIRFEPTQGKATGTRSQWDAAVLQSLLAGEVLYEQYKHNLIFFYKMVLSANLTPLNVIVSGS